MVVVLPAPLGPRKPNTSPAGDLEVEALDAAAVAVGDGERLGPHGVGGGGHGQSDAPAGLMSEASQRPRRPADTR